MERNDNGETSRAGGARRVGCLASPRRRRARPAGARPDECAARAETGRGTSRAVRRDDPRSPSSRRFERATRFSKTTRGHLVGSVVSATRRTCSSDTVCCICASFSRLLWNIVGRSERAPRGEHSGAPASARQRAIRRQEKKPRQLARGSVSPPAQLTRRLGKKRRTRAEPSASSSQAVAKKEFSKLYHRGSMFSRPSRFAAARITASESDFTLARSRPRGWRVRARRSGGRHFGARKRRRPSALERDVSGARAHADHGDCGHDAGSRVGDARVRARTPRLQNAHRGRLRVEDARLGARSRDARGARRARRRSSRDARPPRARCGRYGVERRDERRDERRRHHRTRGDQTCCERRRCGWRTKSGRGREFFVGSVGIQDALRRRRRNAKRV